MRPGPSAGLTARLMQIASGLLRQGRLRRARPVGHGIRIERAGPAAGRDGGVDVAHAVEPVVPGIAFEAAVGLEQTVGDAGPFGGAAERLGLGRLGVAGHHQRAIADGGTLRGLLPVLDVGMAGAPGAELGRRCCDVDVGLVRALAVLEGGARVRIGGHGAVDGETGGLAHLGKERGLDGFLAGGQHQLQIGAVVDIGGDRPLGAVHGFDGWAGGRPRRGRGS